MRMTILVIAIGIVVLAGAYLWGSHVTREPKHATVEIRDREFRVEVEDTVLGRAQGLSGRESLPADSGMLFVFGSAGDHGFWMKDMKFAIDIIWIEDGKIVGLSKNLQPEPEKTIFTLTTYHPPQPVRYVLEVSAGTIEQYGFQIGDSVKFEL